MKFHRNKSRREKRCFVKIVAKILTIAQSYALTVA